MLVTPAIRELEGVLRTTPLGLRFWDPVLGRHVNDGLLVTAAALDVPSLPRIALPNRTGGLGFRTLPGLRDSDLGASSSAFWSSPPVHRDYLIRMTDTQERFLPLTFRATAPHSGWFTPPFENALDSLPVGSIPLFPDASRSLGPGAIAVRAELWDQIADSPAAWAFVQLRVSTQVGIAIAHGLADHHGHVLAAFPHTEPILHGRATVLPTEPGNLNGLTWSLEFAIFYRRLPGDRLPPDLCDILGQPHAGTLDPNALEIRRDVNDLQFGSNLHLRASNDPLGRILIRPG